MQSSVGRGASPTFTSCGQYWGRRLSFHALFHLYLFLSNSSARIQALASPDVGNGQWGDYEGIDRIDERCPNCADTKLLAKSPLTDSCCRPHKFDSQSVRLARYLPPSTRWNLPVRFELRRLHFTRSCTGCLLLHSSIAFQHLTNVGHLGEDQHARFCDFVTPKALIPNHYLPYIVPRSVGVIVCRATLCQSSFMSWHQLPLCSFHELQPAPNICLVQNRPNLFSTSIMELFDLPLVLQEGAQVHGVKHDQCVDQDLITLSP